MKAPRPSTVRTSWSRPQRTSSARASEDDLSSAGSRSRWFVGKITMRVKGTTRNSNRLPDSHAALAPARPAVTPASVPSTASVACITAPRR